jgi:hypothetical protein
MLQRRPKLVIVVSKYNEDTGWLSKLRHPYVVYTKTDDTSKYNVHKNKGNEASAYLKYILDHWDSLPEHVAFIHAHESDWHHKKSMADKLNSMHVHGDYTNLNDTDCVTNIVKYDGRKIQIFFNDENTLSNEPESVFEHMKTWYVDTMEPHFGKLREGTLVTDRCCAQFIVSRKAIRRLPREFYERHYNWLMTTELENYVCSRFYEWTWKLVFKNTTI